MMNFLFYSKGTQAYSSSLKEHDIREASHEELEIPIEDKSKSGSFKCKICIEVMEKIKKELDRGSSKVSFLNIIQS